MSLKPPERKYYIISRTNDHEKNADMFYMRPGVWLLSTSGAMCLNSKGYAKRLAAVLSPPDEAHLQPAVIEEFPGSYLRPVR